MLERKDHTKAEGEEMVALADGNYDKIKAALEKKVVNPSIRATLENKTKTEAQKTELVKLTDQTFDDLFANGGLCRS